MSYKDPEKQREYLKRYHLLTWDKRKTRHKSLKQKRKVDLARWFRGYKTNLVCSRCSENNPTCLDFHHLEKDLKLIEIANLVSQGYSKENILKEVGKCIVLCANCHRKEHGV